MEFKKKFELWVSSKSNKAKLITILGLFGICLIALSSLFPAKETSKKHNEELTNSNSTSLENYVNCLELKIDNMVRQIEGVGNSKVLITMEKGIENVYANSEKKLTNSNENLSGAPSQRNDIQRDVVVIDGNNGKQALIVTKKEPTVKGVVVVCEGASNGSVAKNVTDAISKSLNIKCNKISVVKGNPSKNNLKIKHKNHK